MALYRYLSNLVATDNTAAIRLAGGRVMQRGGAAVDLSDQEAAQVRGRYVIEAVEAVKSDEQSSNTTSTASAEADVAEQPKAPGQQSIPVPAASPQGGSAPVAPASVTAPSGQSTPLAGL